MMPRDVPLVEDLAEVAVTRLRAAAGDAGEARLRRLGWRLLLKDSKSTKNARVYMEKAVPLGVVARGLGGDVVSFAQFIRQLGGQIVTCAGSAEERARGIGLARRYRGLGAVLDPYTAWVAAEIGVLPALKAWFGTLRTPASTTTMIDGMINREDEGRGREQMTLSYHDGQFYRDEVTDEFRDRQIAALTRVRDGIVANSEIVPVLVPDAISEFSGNAPQRGLAAS